MTRPDIESDLIVIRDLLRSIDHALEENRPSAGLMRIISSYASALESVRGRLGFSIKVDQQGDLYEP